MQTMLMDLLSSREYWTREVSSIYALFSDDAPHNATVIMIHNHIFYHSFKSRFGWWIVGSEGTYCEYHCDTSIVVTSLMFSLITRLLLWHIYCRHYTHVPADNPSIFVTHLLSSLHSYSYWKYVYLCDTLQRTKLNDIILAPLDSKDYAHQGKKIDR